MPSVTLEARLDRAFFGDAIVRELDRAGVRFTISVPFERFAELKPVIAAHRQWKSLDEIWADFENGWKPKVRQRLVGRVLRPAEHPEPVRPEHAGLFDFNEFHSPVFCPALVGPI